MSCDEAAELGVEPHTEDIGWVELYHGTTGHAAESIRREGLRFVDLGVEAEVGAQQFDLDAEILRGVARRLGYTEMGNARATSVSVTGHPIYAARYSGVDGGEARREFYIAAWLTLNDSQDRQAAESWSYEQTRSSRVVAVLRLPAEVVREELGFDRLGNPRGLDRIELEINLHIQRRVPADWVVDVRSVERAMKPVEVGREYGQVPRLEDLPPDGPRMRDPIWWESTVRDFFAAQ